MQGSRLFSRWVWHVVLALVMLFMQQAGVRHSLQHATNRDSAPAHTACVECLAHHAADSTLLPTVVAPVLGQFDHVLTADAAQPQRGQGVTRAYQSRAPPAVFSA